MFNLQDIMAGAPGMQAMEAMAKQFGLSTEQSQAAMQAMLPAFTAGLNRATQTPADFAGLFGQMAAMPEMMSQIANPMVAGPAMMETGAKAMQAIFGGGDVSNAVVQQAAMMSGVGQEIMSKIMPVMATTLMGSLMQGAMTGQNPLGAVLSSVMGQLMPPGMQQASEGMMGMVTSMFGALFGAKPAAPAMPNIPGMEALSQFMAQMGQPSGEASGPRSVGQQAADTWNVTLGQLFQAGRDMQDKQFEQFEQLLGQFAPKR